MAVDSKIETFAKHLFLYLYYESEALPKPKSYAKPEDSYRLFKIVQAVMCRQEIFHWLYAGVFYQKYDSWKHSTMDFYVYLREELSDFAPYLKPNVFDKVLISCAFVLEMGLLCAYKNSSLYLDFPICYAMFFDSELKEEFYSKGGWVGLVEHSLKYQPAHQYISEILAKCCVNDGTFVENLIRRANTDYDLQYLLQLLEERIAKYKGDLRKCYECLPLFSMSFESELLSEIQTISTVERMLQILLLLMPPLELKEFEKKAAACFLISHLKEQEAFKLKKGDQVNPLSLSQSSLESAFHEIYADERKVEHIRGAVKKLATEEVFRRIFMDRKLPDECRKYDPSPCACCLRKLETSKKKELSFHIETIKAVIDEVTFSERTNQVLSDNEIGDLCQKKNKTQTATASLNLSQDRNLVDEDLALKLFLALGIKTSVSYILPNTETVVKVKSSDESHQFKNGKNYATNQTAAKRTKIKKKKASGRSMRNT